MQQITSILHMVVFAIPAVLLTTSLRAQEACNHSISPTINVGISQHGNICRFESPVGSEHIRIGPIREGYALCSQNSLFSPTTVAYDAADVEAGFGPATVVQSDPFPTIVRTTTNGLEVTQRFSWDSTERDLTVTMTVRNVSGAARFNVKLDRYFDGDIDGSEANDRYARGADSVWGFENQGHGLLLTDILYPALPHSTAVHTFAGHIPASCGQASLATPTAVGDFVGRLSYNIGTLNAGVSRTVRLNYRRM